MLLIVSDGVHDNLDPETLGLTPEEAGYGQKTKGGTTASAVGFMTDTTPTASLSASQSHVRLLLPPFPTLAFIFILILILSSSSS